MHLKSLVLANIRSPNVGNGALVTGTINSFIKSKPGYQLHPELYSWDDITFSNSVFPETFFQKLQDFQLLLIPGAVTFNGRADHTRGGSRLNLNIDELNKIKVPVVAQGLSYRHWRNDLYPNLKALTEFLSEINSNDRFLIGLRNDGTKTWLQETTGVELNNLPECPDPGFFVCPPRYNEVGRNLFISVNFEDSKERYQNLESLGNLTKALAESCELFCRNTDEQVVFVPHSFEDYEMILMICSILKPKTLHQRVRVLSLPGFENHMSIYEEYRNARAVVAMRIHSLSPALGMRIPTMVISTQQRMSVYMKNLNLANQLTAYDSSDLMEACITFINEIVDGSFNFERQDLAIVEQVQLAEKFYEKAKFL